MKDFPEVYEESKLNEMYAKLSLPDETVTLLKDYFAAFASFYQIISLRDAFKIIKRQNGSLISENDFIAFSEIVRHDKKLHYYILGEDELYDDVPDTKIMDREIVHDSLVDVAMEIYYDCKEAQSKKPLYIPEKEELLKYSEDYYERTPQTEALFDFFQNKMGMDTEEADDMVGECIICITCSNFPKENPLEEVYNDFFRMRVSFTRLQEAEFISLVCDLINNTRHPCNRGFTPNELANRIGIGDIQTISGISAAGSENIFDTSDIGLVEFKHNSMVTGEKVGRNDPCPCGSGKKYKKCCGR